MRYVLIHISGLHEDYYLASTQGAANPVSDFCSSTVYNTKVTRAHTHRELI